MRMNVSLLLNASAILLPGQYRRLHLYVCLSLYGKPHRDALLAEDTTGA